MTTERAAGRPWKLYAVALLALGYVAAWLGVARPAEPERATAPRNPKLVTPPPGWELASTPTRPTPAAAPAVATVRAPLRTRPAPRPRLRTRSS